MLNGINLEGLNTYANTISEKPEEAISAYGVTAKWLGGVKTQIQTHNQKVGSAEIVKDFHFDIDEPEELLGSNSNPTPQDYLLGGLAGCMMVNFVAGASQKGIKLESVELKIKANLDLRGFLNVGDHVPIPFEKIFFNYEVKGDGTQNDYDEIIKDVQHFSPNYRTISDAVNLSVSKI
jgi:uncharacterized OsmC-like protein